MHATRPHVSVRKYLVGLLFLLFVSISSHASHLLGGSITWSCLPGGQYTFTLTLYRDCTGTPLAPQTETLTTNAGGPITCTKVAINYLNKECNALPCQSLTAPYVGGIEEHIYTSGPVTFSGTPPPSGWYFAWESCCRPNTITNLNVPGSAGYTLMAQIFSANAGNCHANGPQFLEKPNQVICNGVVQKVVHTAFDLDGDSLHYAFTAPLDDGATMPPPAVAFAPGYSAQAPFSQSAGTQLDPNTGILTLTNVAQGAFAYSIAVEKWRNGQLMGIISRDLPVFARPCTPPPGMCGSVPNLAPALSFQWFAGFDTLTPVLNSVNGMSYYTMEVNSGTPIKFGMQALDNQLNPNCTPQLLTFLGASPYLSPAPNYNNSGTCPTGVNCATVSSANSGGGFVAAVGNAVEFNWTPTCANFNSLTNIGWHKRSFDFYFQFEDNACPFPLSAQVCIRITVTNTQNVSINATKTKLCLGDSALLAAPSGFLQYMWNTGDSTQNITVTTPGTYYVTCVDSNLCAATDSITISALTPYTQTPEICLVTFDEAAGFNKVVWKKPSKTGTKAYLVYRYVQQANLQLLDTVGVNALSEYVDTSVHANAQPWSYYIALVDSCNNTYGSSATSHTTMWLTATQPNANQVALSWTPYTGANPSRYVIYRNDSLNAPYIKRDSVSAQVFTYIDSNLPAGNGFSYKIGAVLDSGCVGTYKTTGAQSISNICNFATIGIAEERLVQPLQLYPNPTTGSIQLSRTVAGQYRLFTTNGQLLMQGALQGNALSINHVRAGLYVLEITTQNTGERSYFKIEKL